MDQATQAVPVFVYDLIGVWFVLAFGAYAVIARRLARDGGKVSAKEFGQPEMFVCCAFIGWMVLNIAAGFGKAQKDVSAHDIVQGAGLFFAIVVIVFVFLAFRKIPPFRQFGFTRLNPFYALFAALGLVVCAEPIVILTEKLTALAMHGQEQPQNVVEFFLNASERSDKKAIAIMLFLACVVAPIAEETIFRGFIYGVLKRHVGGIAAGIFSAALFGAMHMNLGALPALFILALCLTTAYEITGSLLTNIFMHGLFNLTMLLLMLHFAPSVTP